MRTKLIQYAQGDLLIEKVDTLPSNLKTKPLESGRIILAHGEVTGHAHAIASRGVEPWIDDAGVTYLDVQKAVALLKHDEHGTVRLPKGKYRVIRQREYAPQAIRQVAD